MKFTIENFLKLIFDRLSEKEKETFLSLKGDKIGFFSEYDPDWELERRYAACIAHEILSSVLKEADEKNLSKAYELLDIFECRSCTGHIAQIYEKGIMTANNGLFELRKHLLESEAPDIIDRMFDNRVRIVYREEEKKPATVVITEEEFIEMLRSREEIFFMDIRPCYEVEKYPFIITEYITDPDVHNNLENGVKDKQLLVKPVNIPSADIIRNPYRLKEYFYGFLKKIVLYGENDSCRMTAECLVDSGYKNIYIIKD